ncbi:MAG: hypothetical protein PF447_00750, partial [Spirochaetaceae bacterium]|nr:hypothetical protein [Spirochaetaceae bacterium]
QDISKEDLETIIDRTQWLVLGAQEDNLFIELWGDFPAGSLKMALSNSDQWMKSDNENSTYISLEDNWKLKILNRNQILLYNTSEQPIPDETLYINDFITEDLQVYISIEGEFMDNLWKNSAIVQNLSSSMKIYLYSRESLGNLELQFQFESIPEKERALQAASRVFLLGQLGSRIMESENFFQGQDLIYREIYLNMAEWTMLLQMQLQGVEK